jgi:hypothetical protein
MNSLKFQDTKGILKYSYQLSNTRCSVLEIYALATDILPFSDIFNDVNKLRYY